MQTSSYRYTNCLDQGELVGLGGPVFGPGTDLVGPGTLLANCLVRVPRGAQLFDSNGSDSYANRPTDQLHQADRCPMSDLGVSLVPYICQSCTLGGIPSIDQSTNVKRPSIPGIPMICMVSSTIMKPCPSLPETLSTGPALNIAPAQDGSFRMDLLFPLAILGMDALYTLVEVSIK